jgi:hypothetical protein
VYPLLLDIEETKCVSVFFPEGTLAERAVQPDPWLRDGQYLGLFR